MFLLALDTELKRKAHIHHSDYINLKTNRCYQFTWPQIKSILTLDNLCIKGNPPENRLDVAKRAVAKIMAVVSD